MDDVRRTARVSLYSARNFAVSRHDDNLPGCAMFIGASTLQRMSLNQRDGYEKKVGRRRPSGKPYPIPLICSKKTHRRWWRRCVSCFVC